MELTPKTLAKSATYLENDVFKKIINWDLTAVRCYIIKKGYCAAEQIDQLEKQYKRFIFLCTMKGSKRVPFSYAVDQMWHSHILFTQDYISFCDKVNGKYIHHCPVEVDEENKTAIESLEFETLELYKTTFGERYFSSLMIDGAKCRDCMGPYDCYDDPEPPKPGSPELPPEPEN
ncbi:hypothetical protein KXD93_14035 [Mucilaginibacter sp. BJC16-A38]|uniref:glycine-rich domain-containing protein n=1 Tax=Mucilaginibacter phenanthrenivorans TaxID=1234842 RepID=UPI0021570A10|nr:hypothetical protein [Mucilaginibacter phenanthrenivorans]MCR8558773.1 hypothetical protein [Mucilaginibacter phenanthrenivorans]